MLDSLRPAHGAGGGRAGGGVYGIFGQMEGPARWIVGRVRSAPDVWFPAIARVTSSRATHMIMYRSQQHSYNSYGYTAELPE